jgi:hypothetical protein
MHIDPAGRKPVRFLTAEKFKIESAKSIFMVKINSALNTHQRNTI